jgi:hypothetical protein
MSPSRNKMNHQMTASNLLSKSKSLRRTVEPMVAQAERRSVADAARMDTSFECDSGQDKLAIYRQSQQPNQGVSQLINIVDWNITMDSKDNKAQNWSFLDRVTFKTKGTVKCTEYDKNGSIAHVHKSTIFLQSNNGIPNTWYLLDNQSTCDIVSNPKIIKNIRQVEGYMQLATQAGSTTTNWMADVPGYYFPVWFHPGGITNILSLVNMIAKYHVTYDSCNRDSPNQLCVHKEDGQQRKFKESKWVLFYLDMAQIEEHAVLAVSTIENNKSNYAVRDYSCAQLARKIQILVGCPELKDFVRYLDGNYLPNCPVTQQDAINAHAIFGRNIGSIKGKTTRRKLQGILGAVSNNLPKESMLHYPDITLCIHIRFVSTIPFFLSISRNIRFVTAEVLNNRKQASLIKALQQIHYIYHKCGF